MIPVNTWILKGCAGLAILCVVALWFDHRGASRIQKDWDASVARGELEIERLKGEAGKVTVRTETEYVEVEKFIRIRGETIVEQVPVYIPRDLPELPGTFRVLHDAAADQQPLPDSPADVDAAPVAPTDVASTVAGNYYACHETAARLTALQGWVTEQHQLNPRE